ncbi:stemmadenine O-acetyltransferase-like [Tripterygium wilfordii]|uniref:stemmadenine O-acetyltransferase-like n=1 Tax=Tripterygium wilfordii TaxID=458696 RepID=UPI0018F85816|nr:stemmadenine O-acetyltransferase-like [Tripterygium wilfordii]
MTMEVEIVSRECIKPSSPTLSTHHLKTHKSSLLDQFVPSAYFPLILFYQPNQPSSSSSISETSQVLKQSLSQILTLYYPLAGKAEDHLSIDCNDEGACYINARIDCNLCDYLKHPTTSAFPKFLPDEIMYREVVPGDHVLMIQETLFSCGGIAIGVVASHKIFDATALCTFMRTWAIIARDSIEGAPTPDFSAPSIFPQNHPFPQDLTTPGLSSLLIGDGMSVMKRFVFDGSVLSNLKAKAASSMVPNPTRTEVASAFLLKRIMSAFKLKSGTQKPALVTNTVNLRRRAVPQFPETFVGNFVILVAKMISKSEGEEIELCDFVHQMREAVLAINGDLVKSFEGDEGLGNFCGALKEFRELVLKSVSEGMEQVAINSWCNLGLYEVDYGWGKPLWIPFAGAVAGAAQLPPVNMILLMDARDNKGVEAWVALNEQVMHLLENDEELLSLASVNPSPL